MKKIFITFAFIFTITNNLNISTSYALSPSENSQSSGYANICQTNTIITGHPGMYSYQCKCPYGFTKETVYPSNQMLTGMFSFKCVSEQQYKMCPNGQYVYQNETCPQQYKTCPDGTVTYYNQSCPQSYKWCSYTNSYILNSETCQQQYKWCQSTNSYIPQNQTCQTQLYYCDYYGYGNCNNYHKKDCYLNDSYYYNYYSNNCSHNQSSWWNNWYY